MIVQHNPKSAYLIGDIPINDIIISDEFMFSIPRSAKMERVREYYERTGEFDKPIIVAEDGTLVDGYIRYLIAREKGLKHVTCVQAAQFVKGRIIGEEDGKNTITDKIYEWRVPYDKLRVPINYSLSNKYFKKIGDVLIVEVQRNKKMGFAMMRVEKIIFSTDATKYVNRRRVVTDNLYNSEYSNIKQNWLSKLVIKYRYWKYERKRKAINQIRLHTLDVERELVSI